MISSLSSGVSGLESYQQEMDAIGNNIANVNTTGFKAGTVDFADSFSNMLQGGSSTTPAVQVGTGVGIDAVDSNWTQGTISSGADMTQSDLAISGNGFFQVKDASGNVYATRDGTFQVDASGNLTGIITRGDIMRTLLEGTAETMTVIDAAATDLEVAYPDETLQAAVGKMLRRDIGRLPVVNRSVKGKVVGYLGRADILAARSRLHDEEERREQGPLLAAGRLRRP